MLGFLKEKPWASSLRVALAAFAFYSAYLWIYGQRNFGGNASGFLHISQKTYRLPPNPNLILKDDSGYDGQFYYYVALDPSFSNRPLMETMQVSGYRYQRILYPVLSRLFSFGNSAAIPFVMVALNLLAISAGTFLLAGILRLAGLSPLFSLLFPFTVGPLISLVRCTAEPLSLLALLAAVYFYAARKNFLASALCFAAGGLARELVLGAAALFILHLLLRREKFSRILPYAIPFAVFFAWQVAVWKRTGEWLPTFNTPMAAQTLGFVPFSGLFEKWMDLARALRPGAWGLNLTEMLTILNIFFAGGTVLYFGIRNWRNYKEDWFLFCWLGLLYFANLHPATIAPSFMLDIWGYGRHSIEVFLSLILLYAWRREKYLMFPMAIHAGIWLMLAVILL